MAAKRYSGTYTYGSTSSGYNNEVIALRNVIVELRSADPNISDSVVSAISKNINLWGIFEFTASDSSNRLPLETREAVARLAEHVRYLSFQAAKEPKYILKLIEINETILSGLRSQSDTSPAKHATLSSVNINV